MNVALVGLGGVGKTQLAIEYAYRHAQEYDAVLWVRAEEPIELATDYARLASDLELPEKNAQEQQVQIDAVRQWLDAHGDWLLIFDNATEPNAIRDYLPKAPSGHVLITSREKDWTGTAKIAEVSVMEPDEAIDLLVNLSGCDDREAAAKLADELGYLPLALTQAAAYIRQSKIDLTNYVELFDQRRAELWKHEKEPENYPATVGTTWSLAFEKLEQEEPHAITLLNACAFLAPDDIPRFLFEQPETELEGPVANLVKDPLVLNAAIAALGHYSLIEAAPDTFSIHRLVQIVVRDRMDETSKTELPGVIAQLVEAAFPHPIQTNVEGWPKCDALIPHGLAAAEQAEATGAQADAAEVLNSCGEYSEVRAAFVDAKNFFARAERLFVNAYNANHPRVALVVSNLGTVFQELGDITSAKTFFERALEIDEAAYGHTHQTVAIRLNNLGSALEALRDLEGAQTCYEKALKIGQEIFGPNDPRLANRLNNLGLLLCRRGDLVRASEYLEQALQMAESENGRDNPLVANIVNNIGVVLANQGDLEGARKSLERALRIVESTYGPEHPLVARACMNLGSLFEREGELTSAKQEFERAMRIFTQVFGEDHPNTQGVRRNLESLGEE